MSVWLEADNAEEFRIKLQARLKPIPPRGLGQTKEMRECWIMAKALYLKPKMFGQQFPVTIHYKDRPDFIVTKNYKTTGVEVVEAVQNSIAHAWALANKLEQCNPDLQDAFRYTTYYRRASKQPTKAELLARPEGSRSDGDRWLDKEPEQEWVACMKDCLIAKAQRANTGNYGSLRPRHLLVYDDINAPPVNFNESLRMIAADIEVQQQFWSAFDCLHILQQEAVHSFNDQFVSGN